MDIDSRVLIISILAMGFISAIAACGAIETGIPVMKTGNLSVDLGPDYVFKEPSNESSGMNPSGIAIEIDNIKDPEAFNAVLTISPKSTENIFLSTMIMSILEMGGAHETDNLTLTDSNGQNITLHAFGTTENMATKGNEMFFAIWDLDSLNSCTLISTFDEETSKRIVHTLTLRA